MTQPNQYTETVQVKRRFSSPKLIVGFDVTDGTPGYMTTQSGKTKFVPEMVTITYEAKRLTTLDGPVEWAVTYLTVQGPRLLSKGGTGSTVRWTDSSWPCLDADDMDTYPRWLVQLIIANLPKMVPFLGYENLTMETSWEMETYGDDLSPSAQPFEV